MRLSVAASATTDVGLYVSEHDPDMEPAGRGVLEPAADQPKRPQRQEHDDGGRDAEEGQTRPRGHADRGGGPQAGRGRQAADRRAVLDDRARTKKADAGHDLGGDP